MSSLRNHLVEDDIISAFKTTQNQSWSMFSDKLGDTPVHDRKKKNVFRPENPIKLSNEDIPVFGLVPRLEKLTLVSCNKCSMIVKKDCIHHHYDRRHNSSEDDNFSLERFILPTIKTNKHRKQKITTIRKHSDKKMIDDEDIDPIVIKTEFDEFEYERLTEMNRANIIDENEMQYEDDSEVNLAKESCDTNKNRGVSDWNLPTYTQNLMLFGDHNDNTAVSDEDCNKLSSDDSEQQSNTINSETFNVLNAENISCINSSIKLLTKSYDSNKKIEPNIVVDFSGIMSDDDVIYDEDPNDEYYQLPSRIESHRKQTNCSIDVMDSNVTSNNNVLSDGIAATNYQSSTSPICVEEKTKLTSSENSESENLGSENDECSNNVTTSIDQSTTIPIDDNEETQFTSCNKYSNVINNETGLNTIEVHQCKVNDDLQNDNCESSSNEEQTKCTPSSSEYCDETSDSNLDCNTMQMHQTIVQIKKEYDPLRTVECPPYIKEEYQLPPIPLSIKEEYQPPFILKDIKEEYQSPVSIKEELNSTTNTECAGFLCNEINDSSNMVNSQLPLESMNNEQQITDAPSCEDPSATSSNSSNNSITSDDSDEQSYASPKEYQLPIEPPHIEENTQIILSPQFLNLDSNKKEKHNSHDVSKVTPSEVDTRYSETKTKLLSNNTNVYAEFMNKNYTDSVIANISSSLPPLSAQEEIIFSPNNNFTFNNRNNESTDVYSSSDDRSTMKLLDIKEFKSSLTANYSHYLDSNVSTNKYYQSAIGYHTNLASIPLSPSSEYSDTSDEEVYESAEENENGSYLLLPKVLNNYDETSSTSSNECTNEVNNTISNDIFASYDQQSASSLSNKEKSQDILLTNISDDTMDNNGCAENIEDEYDQSSTESLDSETQSFKCSNSTSSNSSKSSSVISYNESSISSLDTGSKCTSKIEFHSDSSFDEMSDDSVSSSDQSTVLSTDIMKRTKFTQTNISISHRKHKKCVIPSIKIDESIVDSLNVLNDLNKIAQTDELDFCGDCCRVSADLVEYYYPSNTRIEVDADIFFKDFCSEVPNAQITENSMKGSNSQTAGHPVNCSTQTVNDTNIPTGTDQFELNNSDDYHQHINNCLLRLKQFSWDPNNPTKQNSVIENDNKVGDSDNISDFDSYADNLNDNVLYRTLLSGSTMFVDQNHALYNERLKKNIDAKMVFAEDCKYIPSLNANIETKPKKSLKRRLAGQVADDKENQEKNHRWITGSFKKLKRLEFINRKFSCSDESDNNDE